MYEKLQNQLALLVENYCAKNKIRYTELARKANVQPYFVSRATYKDTVSMRVFVKLIETMGYEIEIVRKENNS